VLRARHAISRPFSYSVILGLDPRISGGGTLCCWDGPVTVPVQAATAHRMV